MRRRAGSTTSHSQTLRFLWPTKLHSSSSSRTSHSRRCSFFDRSRGRTGAGRNAFHYPFGNRVARHARSASDAAEGVALGQQLVDLGVLPGLFHGSGLEIVLLAARFELILGPPAAVAITSNLLTGALGAIMLGKDHNLKLLRHPKLTHYPVSTAHQWSAAAGLGAEPDNFW